MAAVGAGPGAAAAGCLHEVSCGDGRTSKKQRRGWGGRPNIGRAQRSVEGEGNRRGVEVGRGLREVGTAILTFDVWRGFGEKVRMEGTKRQKAERRRASRQVEGEGAPGAGGKGWAWFC